MRDKFVPLSIIAALIVFIIVGVFVFERGTSGEPRFSAVPQAFAATEAPRVYIDLATGEVYTDRDLKLREVYVSDPLNSEVNSDFDVEVKGAGDRGDGVGLKFNPKKGTMRPGRYHVEGKIETPEGIRDFSQDFYWGVLAINTNKLVYRPNETANIALAVLDDRGNMVCDASLKLQITNSKSQTRTLSTEGGTIQVNDECKQKKVTQRPDYETEYAVEEPGIYQMTLTAETPNGIRTIQDYFEVRESIPFDIERETATRIYPVYEYPVNITITPTRDFNGIVEEQVPASFEVSNFQFPISNFQIISSDQISNNRKIITWKTDMKAGETYRLSYVYKSPEISPQFYLLGPLAFYASDRSDRADKTDTADRPKIPVFQEARQWQIAVDAIAHVQSKGQNTLSSTTNVLAFTSSNTSGNIIIVVVGWAGTGVTASISDSQGNTYVSAIGPTTGIGSRGQIFYAENISAGANTVTATFSSSVNSNLMIHEYSGIATSNSLDATSASTGFSTTCNSGAATTNQADELIFGSCGTEVDPTSISAGTNFTKRVDVNSRTASEDRVVSATGSYSATMTLAVSVPWIAQMATFKQATTNNTPTITSVTDSPDPVVAGSNVTFSVDWNDADAGENIKAKICKTDSLTNQVCDGGAWASSTAFTTSDPESPTYTTQSGDVATSPNSYYAFVCDDGGACSTSTSGTFTVEGNTTPTITSASDTPDPTNPNRSVTFIIDWNDADSGETMKVKICKTNALSAQNCTGGFWASSTAFTTRDPISLVYDVAGGDVATSPNSYYVFVCDHTANCSTSSSGTFSVNSVSGVPNVKFR